MEYSQPAVFKGAYRHRIDGKGRLPVPAPFRRTLGRQGPLVVTLFDQCLAVFAPSEWEKLEAQLASLSALSRPAKAVARLLASRAADCPLDGQGRILIPPALREAARLEREVLVVGVLSRIEVWAPPAWESFVRDSERLLEDASLDLGGPLPFPLSTGKA